MTVAQTGRNRLRLIGTGVSALAACTLLLLVVALTGRAQARAAGPVFAHTVRVTAVSGKVFLGTSPRVQHRLRGSVLVPVGTTLGLGSGTAKITSRLPDSTKTISGTFAGTSVSVSQPSTQDGVTDVRIADQHAGHCGLAVASRYIPRKRYHLRALATDAFRVQGESGSATPVLSSSWTTTDVCGSTGIADIKGKITTQFGTAPPSRDLLPGERSSGYCNNASTAPMRNRFCGVASSYTGSPAQLGFVLALKTPATQYQLCVRDPSGTSLCQEYPLTPVQGQKVGEVLCTSGAAGVYVSQWKVQSTVLEPSVSVRAASGGTAPTCQFVPIGGFSKTFGALPLSGTVDIQIPGQGVTSLLGPMVLPVGTLIDATNGSVDITSELPDQSLQAASLSGLPFTVAQSASGAGVTTLTAQPADFSQCLPGSPGATAARTWEISADPAFQVDDRYVAESPTGPGLSGWIVVDQCAGTETVGHNGGVQIQDPFQKYTVSSTATAETTCDSASTPTACVGLTSDPATSSASFFITAQTANSNYQLCDDQAGGSIACGTYAFAGSGAVHQGEVVCTTAPDGQEHGIVWGDGVNNLYGNLPSPVNPLFPSAGCIDQAGEPGFAAASGPIQR